MRQKLVSNGTLNKYIAFLILIQNKGDYSQSLKELVAMKSINKSVIIALKKLKIIHWVNDLNWQWLTIREADKQLALEVLNFLLELNKKEIVTPIAGLDEDTKGYIKAIHDHLISNLQNKQSSLEGLKTGMLSKALNQAPMNANTLFSEVQSEQDKKFELLKAVAGGWFAQSDFITPYEQVNDKILGATDDLFNKFFKVK